MVFGVVQSFGVILFGVAQYRTMLLCGGMHYGSVLYSVVLCFNTACGLGVLSC